MVWKTNFVDSPNFDDTKENLFNFDKTANVKERRGEDLNASRVVDARKSIFHCTESEEEVANVC